MSPGSLPLGGRRGRPTEPRRRRAEEAGKGPEEAVGQVLREAHEARAADGREDAGQGQGVPGDCEGGRPGAVGRCQRGGEAPLRDVAAGALRRAGARRRGAGGRVPAPGVVAEVLQRLQPPQGVRLLDDTVNVLFANRAKESAPVAQTDFRQFRQRAPAASGYPASLLSRGRSFSRWDLPVILMTWQWWHTRSAIALAATSSPNTFPQPPMPTLAVMMVERCS